MAETSNAHDAGDCYGCQHPDHAYDGQVVSIDWLMAGLLLADQDAYDREVEMARHFGPVEL